MQQYKQHILKKILSVILLSLVITNVLNSVTLAFEMPKPLSQEERDRLREKGRQDAIKYGVYVPTPTHEIILIATASPTQKITPIPTLSATIQPTKAPYKPQINFFEELFKSILKFFNFK